MYTPFMTVSCYMLYVMTVVISLQKIPYVHRIWIVLANPTYMLCSDFLPIRPIHPFLPTYAYMHASNDAHTRMHPHNTHLHSHLCLRQSASVAEIDLHKSNAYMQASNDAHTRMHPHNTHLHSHLYLRQSATVAEIDLHKSNAYMHASNDAHTCMHPHNTHLHSHLYLRQSATVAEIDLHKSIHQVDVKMEVFGPQQQAHWQQQQRQQQRKQLRLQKLRQTQQQGQQQQQQDAEGDHLDHRGLGTSFRWVGLRCVKCVCVVCVCVCVRTCMCAVVRLRLLV